MTELAQDLAYAPAQKEIAVTFIGPSGKPEQGAASPRGFPKPSDPAFDEFVARIVKDASNDAAKSTKGGG